MQNYIFANNKKSRKKIEQQKLQKGNKRWKSY